MSLTLFKGNKANQGALFSIRFAAKLNKANEDFKPGGFFISLVKQVSWNEKNHTGVFSGGDTTSIKLDQFEAAKILHVIERNYNVGDISGMEKKAITDAYGFFNMHRTSTQETYINFSPWQRKGAKEQTGFGLYITRVANGEKTIFGAAFNFGEDILLREYLKLGLEHINMAGYQEDKRRHEENAKNTNGNGSEGATQDKKRPAARTAPAKPAPEPEETDAGDDGEESLF